MKRNKILNFVVPLAFIVHANSASASTCSDSQLANMIKNNIPQSTIDSVCSKNNGESNDLSLSPIVKKNNPEQDETHYSKRRNIHDFYGLEAVLTFFMPLIGDESLVANYNITIDKSFGGIMFGGGSLGLTQIENPNASGIGSNYSAYFGAEQIIENYIIQGKVKTLSTSVDMEPIGGGPSFTVESSGEQFSISAGVFFDNIRLMGGITSGLGGDYSDIPTVYSIYFTKNDEKDGDMDFLDLRLDFASGDVDIFGFYFIGGEFY